ncbi:MAG: helix-turn-helix transcriptional regulator [Asgard group archaeon]|nr:helix-turn-helix transcriptional regulator [Asgard group archaeon]
MNQQLPTSNRLWKYRKERGYTQLEVAYLLELKTSSQICKWERGRSLPNVPQLMRLSAVYRRIADDLMWDLFNQERDIVLKREKKLLEQNEQSSNKIQSRP